MTDSGWVKQILDSAEKASEADARLVEKLEMSLNVVDIDQCRKPDPEPDMFSELYDRTMEVCKSVQQQQEEMLRIQRVMLSCEQGLERQMRGITTLLGELVLLRGEMGKHDK